MTKIERDLFSILTAGSGGSGGGGGTDNRVEQIVTRADNVGLDITGITKIETRAFQDWAGLKSLTWPDVTFLGAEALSGCSNLDIYTWPSGLVTLCDKCLKGVRINTNRLPTAAETVGTEVFADCYVPGGLLIVDWPIALATNKMLTGLICDTVVFGSNIMTLNYQLLYGAAVNTVKFAGKPWYINPTAFASDTITRIEVPWSEGAVSGAPWGATNATIVYDTTYTGTD